MAKRKYSLGLDYGTNSVRALIVDIADGREVASYVHDYRRGELGIVLDRKDPNVARQHPLDYVEGLEVAVKGALKQAKKVKGFRVEDVIGIGVDTTGSTPLPVDAAGRPLAFQKEFKNNINALAWLWKDHSGFAEAEEITALARREHPEYLAKCGGTYSSEWFFSKILHCLRVDAEVFDAAASWVELADYVPGVLTGIQNPAKMKRGVCAAGHKAMYNPALGGLPAKEFLAKLDPRLGELRDRLYRRAYTADIRAGVLTGDIAGKLELPPGIAVAVGAFDAHMGAVGAGIKPGTLVKIMGTSTCDMMVVPTTQQLADVPGLCGIVDGSIMAGYYGLEAGQSAVGDIFHWFVHHLVPAEYAAEAKKKGFVKDGGRRVDLHALLSAKASKLKPGESGLLALDWNNGNRTILVDARLTGLLLGQTLHTSAEEIYRALIEATAFGAATIISRFEEYGVEVKETVTCGGIAEKNPFLMQIYADVTGRPMKIARSAQTCALGAAMFGSVAAGKDAGGYAKIEDARDAMSGLKKTVYRPVPAHQEVYRKLYEIYRRLHDVFGTREAGANLHQIMKELLAIRDEARK